jgi:protein ImuB
VEPRRLSIWWPSIAIERWAKITQAPADVRVALVVEVNQGQRIHAVTAAAALAGARAGMRLTDARAIDPGLQAVPADVEGDAALVERLARWASRWSPSVEIDPPDGLKLDVTGTAHLFGGEARLLAEVVARFEAMGLTARAAIAPTMLAAWGLARFGDRPAIVATKERTAGLLAPLPVAALGLPAEVNRTLRRLGMKTIGALAGIERKPLARRFREADNPLDAIDRALGRKPEPMTPVVHVSPPRAMLRMAEPVMHPEAACQALELLAPMLAAELQTRRLGARRLVLAGYRVDGEVAVALAGCALPSRDAAHLQRLLAEKAQGLDPGFGFDGFVLEADRFEPLDAVQDGLAGGPPPEIAVARLVDRLGSKLGERAVTRAEMRGSHVPERASGWSDQPPLPNPSPARGEGLDARPQRLLDRPEAIAVIYATPAGLPRRFVWRRRVHDVARAEGPERIAPEWWRERSTARARDYYRVEDREGRRYWIFRDGLHDDGRGGMPVWYLHGLFG